LFSENVVLIEGKTELRLLPIIFEKITNKSLGQHKIALVNLGGKDSTKKSLLVLNAMDLPAKAIVDIDYAFRGSVRDGFITDTDPDLNECKNIFKKMEISARIKLCDQGYPTNKGSMLSAEEAFALMAAQSEAIKPIKSLHEKLLKHNIWLWQKGSIEAHLGIDGKNERVWSKYKKDIENQGFEKTISDLESIKTLVNWMIN